MTIHPTYVMLVPVGEDGREIDLPEDDYLDGGSVLHVPATGDFLSLNGNWWRVVQRVWGQPFPARGAMTPCQGVTLHVKREEFWGD
jgi:hypothetical protein